MEIILPGISLLLLAWLCHRWGWRDAADWHEKQIAADYAEWIRMGPEHGRVGSMLTGAYEQARYEERKRLIRIMQDAAVSAPEEKERGHAHWAASVLIAGGLPAPKKGREEIRFVAPDDFAYGPVA